MWDKDELRRIKSIVETALKKEGYECELAAGTFSDQAFWFKTTVFAGSTSDAKREEWNRYCGKFGLRSFDFGKAFEHDGEEYVITSIRPRARKYPVAATRSSDGKVYCFSARMVRNSVVLTNQEVSEAIMS